MAYDNIHMLSEPDEGAIRAHLERLFRRVPEEYPGGMMEIAWAELTGAVKHAEWFPCTPEGIDAAVRTASVKNRERRNCYVGVNPRRPNAMPGGRADTADVEVGFFQFVECDQFESLELLRKAPIPYSFAVTTGRTPHRRPHAYWEVEDPIRNMEAWTAQQRALKDYFKGDAVLDPPRIMRLAGTINYPAEHKEKRGYRVELVTIRTIYDDEERTPTTSQALASVYRWAQLTPQQPRGQEIVTKPSAASTRPILQAPGVDYAACIRAIDNGQDLHNNALRLASHLVCTNEPSWVIRELLTRLLRPVSDGGTLGKVEHFIQTARQKYNVPEPREEASQATEGPFDLTPIGILTPSARKPRDWLVPSRMMRRHITMTTAAPGVGKSTLAMEEAVSQASGIDFLGFGIKEPCRVAVINNEETRDELERRIEATCSHFEIPPEAIADRLFVYSGVDAEKIIMARLDKNKNVIPTIHTARLRELVNDLKIDAVTLDPFVQLHYVTESSNEEVSRALVAMRSIGIADHPAAIHVVHHNRKPVAGNSHQAGDINSARGGSSMGGEAHFFFTLTNMSDADGEKLNIEEDDRAHYLRLDDAKGKMAPPQGARWFQRFGEMMPYGLIGEEVGILIPYDTNYGKPHVSVLNVSTIFKVIEEAWQSGNPFNGSPRTPERYLVNMIMREMRMTRTTAKALMTDWMTNGMIAIVMRDTHSNLKGFRVVKWPG